MKRLYALLFAFGMLLSVGAYAQDVTVKIGDEEAFANTNVLIPVYMDATDAPGDGVCSFEFRITYNPDVLTGFVAFHSEIIDINDIITSADTPGLIIFNWEETNANLKIDDVLLEMEFAYAGDYSDIEFDDSGNPDLEIGQCDATAITNTEYIDGSISERTAPIPVSDWALFLGMGLIAIFLVGRAVRIL